MSKLILLISSHEHHLHAYSSVLEKAGYSMICMDNAADAMQKAVFHLPHMIICIEGLKDLELKSFCKITRTNSLVKKIPFLLISATIDKLQFEKLNLSDDRTKLYNHLPTDKIKIEIEQFFQEVQKVLFLQSNVDFNFFDAYKAAESIQKFAPHSKKKLLKRKKVLFHAGGAAQYIYYIRYGQVMTSSVNSSGKMLINSIFCIGDFFGTQPFVTDNVHHQTAMATIDSEIVMIPSELFRQELNSNIEFTKGYTSWIGLFLAEVQAQVLTMAFSPVRKRVSNVLIRLYRKTPNERIKIKRDDLAKLCGTVKETVIRTLSDFKNEKLIEIKNSDIIITDAHSLSNMPD